MTQRRRFKPTKTFEERLAEEAAAQLPEGLARELLLRRARQAETASHMNEWVGRPV
jgi:hypothetical protein